MKCAKVDGLLPDYLAGSLTARELAELRDHLEACPRCREEQSSLRELWTKLASIPELEPSRAADARFQTMLAAYQDGFEQSLPPRSLRWWWADWLGSGWQLWPVWQLASVVLLFGGGLLAGWSLRQRGGDQEPATDTQITELRREVLSLKEQMSVALLQQQSTIERLRGIEWASWLEQPDAATLQALLRVLDSDPNVNVRLAAVEVLLPFAGQARVRQALLDSLPRQQSPLVQIELIDIMVDVEEKGLVPVLESLILSGELNEPVRERARRGLAEMG